MVKRNLQAPASKKQTENAQLLTKQLTTLLEEVKAGRITTILAVVLDSKDNFDMVMAGSCSPLTAIGAVSVFQQAIMTYQNEAL